MENVFTLHHVNAYDTAAGDIVMDVCTYPNDVVVDSLDMDVVRDATARNAYNQQATVKVSIRCWHFTYDSFKKRCHIRTNFALF